MNQPHISDMAVPPDAIILAPQTLDYTYSFVNGRDVFAIVFTDHRVGPCQVLLTAAGAQHASAHLAGMVGDVDRLRAEYQRRHADE